MTQAFSSSVLKLQEKGILDELKRKWWKEERKENACDVSQFELNCKIFVTMCPKSTVGN